MGITTCYLVLWQIRKLWIYKPHWQRSPKSNCGKHAFGRLFQQLAKSCSWCLLSWCWSVLCFRTSCCVCSRRQEANRPDHCLASVLCSDVRSTTFLGRGVSRASFSKSAAWPLLAALFYFLRVGRDTTPLKRHVISVFVFFLCLSSGFPIDSFGACFASVEEPPPINSV